ncbi:MAG: class B sortase [Clostridia bacterium]|nr:class B sortase [Clostridia bacterium]
MNYEKHTEKREKNNKKRKGKVNKKALIVILSIIFILSASYIVWNIIDSKKAKNMDDLLDEIEISEEHSGDKTEMMLKIEELRKINEEIVGWVKIEGTDISFPVLQGKDNSFYLTHNYKKEHSGFGSIFLDKDYDFSKPSSNLLIYGHRDTKGGTMFEGLVNYKNEDFYREHPNIKFATTQEDSEYEIISVFLSRVYYKSEKNVFRYYFFVDAENEKEYNDYVENSKKASMYNIDKTANFGDQLLTLSTCEYSQEDGRLAIVARKIK